MAKNVAIRNAIINNDVDIEEPDVRRRALEHLLEVNPADVSAFRQAIINNKGFWEQFPDLKEAEGIKIYEDNDNLLTPDEDPDIKTIRQIAAQQRVTLGLKDVDDDVLIQILSNNEDECRAYLASISKLGNLNQAHGWKKDEVPVLAPPAPAPPARNKSDDILTADAIKEIRDQARDVLLLRFIKQSENRGQIVQLLTANDKASVDSAAIEMGYPDSVAAKGFLNFPLSDNVKDALKGRLAMLKQALGKNDFEEYVAGLSSDAVLRQEDNLQEDNEEFFKSIPQRIRNNLTEDDMDWAKSVLGTRFLQVALSNSDEDLLPALKTKTEEELAAILKDLFDNDDYIDLAVKGNLAVLKKAMLQSHITSISDEKQLKAMDKAVDLAEFQKALVDAGITPADWVKETDLKDIKQWVRSQIFQNHIDIVSQLGAAPHPQLFKAFSELPVAKQRAMLNDPVQDYHVLNAKDVKQLAVHMGADAIGLAEVVEENKKIAGFQQIHNSVVARILSGFQPPITLSSAQIDVINNDLDTEATKNGGRDFEDRVLYKGIVDKIKAQCGPVNDGSFYQAFGLTRDGSAFKNPPSTREDIIVQNRHNQGLLNAHALIRPTDGENKLLEKQLLGIFLTLNKNVAINPATIVSKFNESKTYNEFIEGVIPRVNLALKAQLYSQLSSSTFYELKNAVLKNNLADPSPAVVRQALSNLNSVIQSINGHRTVTTKSREHFKFLEGVEPSHLYNPSFRGTAQFRAEKMKDKYQALSDDCDLIVDQLRRDQKTIEGFFNLNVQMNRGLPSDVTEKVNEVDKKLNEEMAAIKSNLQFYEKIQQKLSGKDGILQAINDAADNKKSYMFHAKGITRRIETRDKVEGLTFTSEAPPPKNNNGLDTSGHPGEVQKLVLEESIPEGKIAVVDYVQTSYKADKVSKDYEIVGRYTVDLSPPGQMTQKGDQVTKVGGGKFEIEQFPKQTIPVPAKGSQEDVRLIKAKMEFSLALAADAIANLDSPPTKEKPLRLYGDDEEQMRYLWTALIVLGEKNPHMKITADAIKLDRFGANRFDPAQEKGSFLGIGTGFHKESLYQQFKDVMVKDTVEQTVDAVKKMSADKVESMKERPKVDSQAIDAAKSIKDGLSIFRKDAQVARKVEGPEEKQDTGLKNS
ncbi:hypothetical protein [Legionella bononiensis]|uniref:Interaptin n=1 Tax=Legionella bononiensis TaxID=2793102 RepID=A0ABS1WB01_9GAMM|nr:hypothetical protein [Legionella bononiensis]MBL7480227.1 hypothetical protein [Legionella bononiensis]MBL7526541.1 hypothetical protein [Legionella bononiensis]MBL7562965.1 hypothetical protein [Legionella bononiensis]